MPTEIEKEKELQIFSFNTCTRFPSRVCYVEKTLDVLGSKWSFLIIKHLFSGKKRFSELRKLLHDVNARSLTNSLRNLEDNGILLRTVIPTVPVTVEYSLTPKGLDLREVIIALYLWSERWDIVV